MLGLFSAWIKRRFSREGNASEHLSKSNLRPGNAKTSIKQDELQRDKFVKNLSNVVRTYGKSDSIPIGLYGPWGCGKSSLLNFVMEDLKQDKDTIAIVRFNPWNFSQGEKLVSNFFSTLSALIKRSDKSRKAKKAAALLDGFSALAAPAALYPGLDVISKTFSRLADTAKDYASAFNDLENAKDDISNILVKSSKRYVIVIDDIDRLVDSEIRLIFQLVKSMADFKNIVYIMAFERAVVSRALDEITNGQGNRYLEKIIGAWDLSLPPEWRYGGAGAARRCPTSRSMSAKLSPM